MRPRRYRSDTSDAEWQVLAPHVPAGTGRGRPVIYPRRDVVHAIRYLDRTGRQWDALPADFPHHKLVYHYFKTWTADSTLNRMHNSLREQVRTQVEGRNRQPSAANVNSQTAPNTTPRWTNGPRSSPWPTASPATNRPVGVEETDPDDLPSPELLDIRAA